MKETISQSTREKIGPEFLQIGEKLSRYLKGVTSGGISVSPKGTNKSNIH